MRLRQPSIERPATMTTTASIMDETGENLITVDLATLPAEKLEALRTEAGETGDAEMVTTIDRLTGALPTADLYDADTATLIGPATTAQHEASNAAGRYDGAIVIDEDGDVVDNTAWYRGELRRVYTMGAA